jgi:flagellar biosynthesis/type III secretory pathway ATPase
MQLTVAEHFRDAEGQDVLLFIDNIFRFTRKYNFATINFPTIQVAFSLAKATYARGK